MSATIAEVREALSDAVEVAGLRCEPYLIDVVNPPCAMVDRRQMDPRMVFGAGTNGYRFRLLCYFGRTSERGSQVLMDEYLSLDTTSASSVKAAVESGDNWPDGLVHYCEVVNIGDTSEREVAGIPYLTVELDLEVVW